MPGLVRWFIKAAWLYFVLALLTNLVLAAQSALDLSPSLTALLPVYFHLFMVGFVAQLIFGVAYWMFPKVSKEQPRGREEIAVAVFVALNGGLLLRAIGEPAHALRPEPLWGWVLVASAVLQWLAGMAFVANTWARVKRK